MQEKGAKMGERMDVKRVQKREQFPGSTFPGQTFLQLFHSLPFFAFHSLLFLTNIFFNAKDFFPSFGSFSERCFVYIQINGNKNSRRKVIGLKFRPINNCGHETESRIWSLQFDGESRE